MSYLALYRKYRPINFSDLVGQNYVSDILKNEVLNNKISHAYLFSGPRGTGKTSTAKIFSKMVNCNNLDEFANPCGKCFGCLYSLNNDVVEIDAASNNGVDEIRALRDKVNLVPSAGKYKIYIIDEVHMLTTQAFNALLKTLEEPPSHVIFILATTEFYKIPDTVVSRCQKFQFYKFSDSEIVSRLNFIATKEGIKVDDDALLEIARLSFGGLRDAINMLDQLFSLKNESKIFVDDVYQLNGVVSYTEIYNLVKFIHDKDYSNIIKFVENLDMMGISSDKFIIDFVDLLKDVLIYKVDSLKKNYMEGKLQKIKEISDIYSFDFIYDFILSLNDISFKLKKSDFSSILLITYFLNVSEKKSLENGGNFKNKTEIKKNEEILLTESKELQKEVKSDDFGGVKLGDKIKKIRINNAFATASKSLKINFINNWGKVMSVGKSSADYNSLVGILDDIEILVVGMGNIIFLVKYDSLIDRIYNYVDSLEKLLYDIFGVRYKLVFLTQIEWDVEKKKYVNKLKKGDKYQYITESDDLEKEINDTKKVSDDDALFKISSIFGEDVITYVD